MSAKEVCTIDRRRLLWSPDGRSLAIEGEGARQLSSETRNAPHCILVEASIHLKADIVQNNRRHWDRLREEWLVASHSTSLPLEGDAVQRVFRNLAAQQMPGSIWIRGWGTMHKRPPPMHNDLWSGALQLLPHIPEPEWSVVQLLHSTAVAAFAFRHGLRGE